MAATISDASFLPPSVTSQPRIQEAARVKGRAALIAHLEPLGFSAQPAVCAAIALAAGIVLSRYWWITSAHLLIGILPSSVLAFMVRTRTRFTLLPLLAAWLLLGWYIAEVQPHPSPHRDLLTLANGTPHTITGEVVRYNALRLTETERPYTNIRMQEQELSVQLAIHQIDGHPIHTGGMRLAIFAPASMTLEPVHCGDTITVDTTLKIPQQYRDPGVWNGRVWLASQGVDVLGAADGRNIALPVRAPHRAIFSGSAACAIHALQVSAGTRLMALGSASHPRWQPSWLSLTEADTGMITAMVTGDRSYLQRGERQGFERTGSFHVLVVSGLHVGLIAALVFAGSKRLHAKRRTALLATAGISLVYAVFTGFGQPVQRALWMVLLYLAARAVFRERHALQAVGVALLCLLAWDPHALFDAGLQMTLLTVIATGGLVAPILERSFGPWLSASARIHLTAIDHSLPPRLAQYRVMLRLIAEHLAPLLPGRPNAAATVHSMARIAQWTLRLLEMLAVSAMVEVVMTIPMAVYFHRATLLALPVNLLLIPLLGLLLPAAVLTAAFAIIAPPLAALPAAPLAVLLHLANGIVQFFSHIQAGDLRIARPPSSLLICCTVLLTFAVWALRMRRSVAIPAMSALVVSILLLLLPHGIRARFGILEITALDVGQGDALLLITPQGKTIMVDCGGPTGGDRQPPGNFEIGEDVVSPVLWDRGIRRLDAVALTHAHSDHMGGMFAVLRNFHPRELWIGNNPPSREYLALLAEATQLGITIRSFHAEDTFTYGGMDVRVLAPAAGYQPSAAAKNDDSLVMRIAWHNTSALLDGDAEGPSEQQMAALPSIHADLLKIGHHGSRTSTTEPFFHAVAPRYAVISVGLHNLYHHPRFETLEKLQASHVQTYRTDLDGITSFYLDGETIQTSP